MKLTLIPDGAGVFKVHGWIKPGTSDNDAAIQRIRTCRTLAGDDLDTVLTFENTLTRDPVTVPLRSMRDWVRSYYTPPP
jgi:hypothetical protein